MKINEFLDDRDDDDGDDGDGWEEMFEDAWHEGVKKSIEVLNGRGKFLVNNNYVTLDNWRKDKTGKTEITSLGDPSRTEYYHVAFFDIEAMIFLDQYRIPNVARNPMNRFSIYYNHTIFDHYEILKKSENRDYYADDIKIYGDVFEKCVDAFIEPFKAKNIKVSKISMPGPKFASPFDELMFKTFNP